MANKIYIHEWREHRGLTQAALGELLDPSASAGTISAYESGKRKASIDRLRAIALVLDTTPGSLLDGPPRPQRPVVPADVIRLWERIPFDRRPHAKEVLATFAISPPENGELLKDQ